MDLCLTKPVVWPELFAALARVAADQDTAAPAWRKPCPRLPTISSWTTAWRVPVDLTRIEISRADRGAGPGVDTENA